ncbi:NADH-quinone oxidoreductase subunit C [Caldichromatium japonicum]|nr:NADH-quinone oxidoreductase subunit C [Caldichromatium japonicum]
MGLRHAGLWADVRDGEDESEAIEVYACLEQAGQYLVLVTQVPLAEPRLSSHSHCYPGVNRLERHAHDLTGLDWLDQPDNRRAPLRLFTRLETATLGGYSTNRWT